MIEDSENREQLGRILLNSINGVGPVTLKRLMEQFGSDPWEILNAKQSELMQVRGVGKQTIEAIQQSQSSEWLKREVAKLTQMKANFLFGKALPDLLQELPDPPIGLYCLGEIPKINCVSIVGTRHPSMYGKKIARQLAYDLASKGICIVSGLARGVDTEAHRGALDAAGSTLAFLGSGLDVIYPPENLDLYRQIQKSGAVLSEFQLGRRADRRTFPMRNRLVAGISLAVVVVESASSGGSMITARLAAEQGRTVFAIPGRVDQPESQGCLDLIRDGATLARNAEDIISEITPMISTPVKGDQTSSFSSIEKHTQLDVNEKLIMSHLSPGDKFDPEYVQKLTQLEIQSIVTHLTMIEINGLIKKLADGKYEVL
jgi:DNA processing protein